MTRIRNRQAPAFAIAVSVVLSAFVSIGHVIAGELIFVPPPKGAGETLDDSAKPRTKALDVVKTLKKDVLRGRVLRIGVDGALRLTGPQFSGEVIVLQRSLESVEMQCIVEEAAMDEVMLTNGDRILGELSVINKDTIVIVSEIAGVIKIPRKMVVSIGFARGKSSLVDSNFATGRMKPWKERGGKWSVKDSKLICSSSSASDAVYVELDQNEAMTFVVKVKSPNLRCYMVLFADEKTRNYGRNSVYVSVYNNECYMNYCKSARAVTVAKRSPGHPIRDNTLRFAYDPATGKAKMWLDSMDLGEVAMPHKPAVGKYVIFGSDYTCEVSRLQVLRGIVPPHTSLGAGAEDNDTIELTTKDQILAKDLILANGKLSITTPFGVLTPSVEKVGQIVFRKKGREMPETSPNDIVVRTSGSLMTFAIKELTAEHLIGSSNSYGSVKLTRGAIKNIRFNINRK